MMKMPSWSRLFLMGCLLLSACHNRENEVNTLSATAKGEIGQQQNLSFVFNKDLVPDSLLYRWDSTAYIEFTPHIRGMFKWNSSSELLFSPSAAFEPGTSYTATVTRQVLQHAGKSYRLGNKQTFHFHTAPLRITQAHLSWARGTDISRIVTRLDLEFNYSVSLTEAASRLRLTMQGKQVSFTSLNSGNGKSLSIRFIPATELGDEETPLHIGIGKGIPVSGSGYVSQKDTTFSENIPSRFNLTVTGITAQHTGAEGMITVNTSQPLQEEDLKKKIRIEPAVPFDITVRESGLLISGPALKADQTYQLTILSSLEGIFGGKMKQDHREQVVFGKLDPAIHFVNTKGIYLSSQGYRNLALSIVNVPAVAVTVIKVYENNLESFFSRSRRYGYHYDYETEESGDYEYYHTEGLGDTVFYKEYETAKLPGQNAARILKMDFEDKIRDYSGVYIICVASKDHYWIQDSKILSLSDIGLIVKEDQDNLYVFANSIRNAAPLSGVKISLVSSTNQHMHTIVTGRDGAAVFRDLNRQAPFRTGLVTAKKDGEFGFVWLQQSRVETSRFDVGGRMPNGTGLNAWIYAERNLYRPGETIRVSTVIRNEAWEQPGEMPVKLRLNMPNGKEFAAMRKILNEEGSCEASFEIPPTALTGTYTLGVYSGNDVLLGNYSFSIEDFIPDRLKAEVSVNKTEYRTGDSVKVRIRADNLFGTPAADRNYECELTVSKEEFRVRSLPEYTFAIRNNISSETKLRQGKTDVHGSAGESFLLDSSLQDAGYLRGNITATVFDETGRPVHRFASFPIYTQPVYLGIRDFDYYTGTRTPMRIGLIATGKDGAVRNNTEAVVTIVKKEWNTVIEQNGSHYKYVSRKQEKVINQQKLRISGENTYFSFTPSLSGEYEIRVSHPGSKSFVSRTFYAWGWSDTQYTSFEVNNEGNVDIRTDKDKYAPGENMQVLFTTPFEGRMLVTVERNRMLQHHYLNTKNKSASLTLKADETFLPNVYITATLFRPMDGGSMPLTVAHGFRNVTIEDQGNRMPVRISMPEKSRSATRQTVTVKTQPGAFVTIAAVDEGILQVKNYKTPDPYDHFYQKVALAVNSYDIYPLLLPEIRTTLSSTGGDGGGEDQQLRVNPMFVNRVKNVSFWSGIRQADGNGIVRYDIDIPGFSGDLRVMAAAYKGKRFGSAEQHMKIADPVIISTALPRFLSPEDEAVVPVTLSNTTARNANATARIMVTGPLGIEGSSTRQISIPPNSEARTVFHINAQKAIGAGKVTVIVDAFSETFRNETEIGIRPAASLQKRTGSGTAAEDQVTSVHPGNPFIPGTASGQLTLSRSPLVQFSSELNDLVHYPYGCLEQTVSTSFPQLYYQDLVKSISGTSSGDLNPAYNVRQAILKIQSMQLSNGALSYWPDGGSESWWGSVYSAHFLLEARKAGYEVNTNTLSRLLQYLKNRLQKRETEIHYYNETFKKEVAAREAAYSLYVLALAEQPQMSAMNYYKSNPDMLAPDSKYLLAAAYGQAGQKAQAMQVLPASFGNEQSNTATGGNFHSYIRDLGISLNALLDTDPGNAQVPLMARQLSEQMKRSRYLSTQEKVWSVLAMGKIARTAATGTSTAAVTVKGEQTGMIRGKDIIVSLKDHLNDPMQIRVQGKGRWYYFWEIKGITADGSYTEEDSYLKIRRTCFDRNGKPISGNSFRQNDLIVVQLALSSQFNGRIDNIAITDMLPAGFEIENARLTELPGMNWIKNATPPEYTDIRDDRINLFTSLGSKPQYFYYMVRAVSPGTYRQGPVQADAMYNGFYHSYHGAGTVKISER